VFLQLVPNVLAFLLRHATLHEFFTLFNDVTGAI